MTAPLPPVVAHAYVSTACQHNRHDYCGRDYCGRDYGFTGGPKKPAVCKWCEVGCLCPAHRDPALDCIGAPLTAVPFVAAEGRREEAVVEGPGPGDELSRADVLALVRRHFIGVVSKDGRTYRIDDLQFAFDLAANRETP